MSNPAIEHIEPVGRFEARALSFKPHSLETLLQFDITRLEAFLAKLYQLLSGQTSIAEKASPHCHRSAFRSCCLLYP